MNNRIYHRFISLALLVGLAHAEEEHLLATPAAVMARLIQGEFELEYHLRSLYGAYSRGKRITLGNSINYLDSGWKGNPETFIDIPTSPLVVVTAYSRVALILTDTTHASMTVRFDTVAELQAGYAEPKVKARQGTETVIYKLRRVTGKWYVLDLPPPRVSAFAVQTYLQQQLNAVTELLRNSDTDSRRTESEKQSVRRRAAQTIHRLELERRGIQVLLPPD